MIKERIYLTDITLHMRGYRQTCNFSKVAQKGRIYSPLPEGYNKKENVDKEKGTVKMAISFPQDLQDRIDKGEVELMFPKGGLLVYAGKDVWEFITKQNEQRRRQLIHSSRAWHSK
jgi:hypothetical protein